MVVTRPSSAVCNAIEDSVGRVLASGAFEAWAGGETLRSGDLILINNSFLFRAGRSTIKNEKHLAVAVAGTGEPCLPPTVVRASRFNAQFKRVPGQRANEVVFKDLDSAVDAECARLGVIVFSLVGRIGSDEPAEVPLGAPGWQTLAYAPDEKAAAVASDGTITLNRLNDIDAAWSAVKSALEANGHESGSLAEHFEPAFHNLQEASELPVDLVDIAADAPSILSKISERIDSQVTAYGDALTGHRHNPDDQETYNELLRVAYNFADGARALIGLVVEICDLKPLLFWLTVAEQVELEERFAKLPFALVGKAKPSLDRYRSVIANARNQAFHDLFAFDRSFRVRLTGDALRSAELHLFREYGKQKEPALDFEDRKLVEVLQGFSRVPVRSVPLGFWDANLSVMESVARLTRRLREALIMLM